MSDSKNPFNEKPSNPPPSEISETKPGGEKKQTSINPFDERESRGISVESDVSVKSTDTPMKQPHDDEAPKWTKPFDEDYGEERGVDVEIVRSTSDRLQSQLQNYVRLSNSSSVISSQKGRFSITSDKLSEVNLDKNLVSKKSKANGSKANGDTFLSFRAYILFASVRRTPKLA
ncbi:hypothetical protein L596_030890 [Steinernema carpocapsae]|uniref:Uncharacterized protein n=1 Tax=Steinernema carpocapsae TaxID=34508 RepID=A0A4U5LNF3_STECR|nr:hypothetical protein L596_030890 [Steinernema carpocapsae]